MAQRAAVWSVLLVIASTALAEAPAPQGPLTASKTVHFKKDEPIRLDLAVGGLRVVELRITGDEAGLLESLLPPRGGVSRFSWLRYTLSVENPGDVNWTLAARVRLLDKKGEVIDEFEFKDGVGAGRARSVDLKRLTLNYIVPLIDRVELTLDAEQ